MALCISFFYARAYNFNVTAFVQANEPLSNPAVLGPDFVVRPKEGHDGQSYYRLAVEPWTTQRVAHGVTLDNPPYRQQRIFYPLVVWCLSLGHAAWVPTVLLAVNIAALTLIGWLGGLWAVFLKRHAGWGLLLPMHMGFAFTLCMDLTEILQMSLAVAALYLWSQRRFRATGFLLMLSVLTKETSLLFAVAGAMVYFEERFRRITPEQRTTSPIVFVLPFCAYVAWQSVMRQVWGQWPLLAGEHNLGLPFVGLMQLVTRTLLAAKGDRIGFSILTLVEVWVLLVLVSTAIAQWRKTPLARPIVAASALYAALGACLSAAVLGYDVNFQRGLSELVMLCFLLLLSRSTARLRWIILCSQFTLIVLRIHLASASG